MRKTGVVGRNCVLVIAIGLCLEAGLARETDAASISYLAGLNSKTQPGLVPFFDPVGLGPLVAIEFTARGTLEDSFTPVGDDWTFSELQYDGTYQSFVQFIGISPTGGPSPFFGPAPGPVTPLGSNRPGFLLVHERFTYSETITDPARLALFVDASANGPFNLQVTARFDFDFTPSPTSPGLRPGFALIDGSATVTYLYAPEPASIVMMSLGLAGVAGLAWRRRRARRR